eukprot:scaffold29995_cov71-Phaeocystis_antarctica.AAC.5
MSVVRARGVEPRWSPRSSGALGTKGSSASRSVAPLAAQPASCGTPEHRQWRRRRGFGLLLPAPSPALLPRLSWSTPLCHARGHARGESVRA